MTVAQTRAEHDWNRGVLDIVRLAAEGDDVAWRMGCIALKLIPERRQGLFGGVTAALERLADDTGVAFETLRRRRHVALVFRGIKNVPSRHVSYSVLREVADWFGKEDKEGARAFIERLAGEHRSAGGRCTVKEARYRYDQEVTEQTRSAQDDDRGGTARAEGGQLPLHEESSSEAASRSNAGQQRRSEKAAPTDGAVSGLQELLSCVDELRDKAAELGDGLSEKERDLVIQHAGIIRSTIEKALAAASGDGKAADNSPETPDRSLHVVRAEQWGA